MANGKSQIANGKWKMENGKPEMTEAKRGGFTFIDLMVLIFAGLILVSVFLAVRLPEWRREREMASRMECVSNLKRVGLGFRLWANDGGPMKFPMAMSTNQGGSEEYNETGHVFRHFLAMTNALGTPRILVCPSDTQRRPVTNWSSGFDSKNISYFVGLEADEAKPQTILSGDRNVVGGVFSKGNVMLCRSNSPLAWTTAIHNKCGNIGLGDGSVQQFTAQGLQKQLQAEFQSVTNEVIRLAIP